MRSILVPSLASLAVLYARMEDEDSTPIWG